MARNLQNKIDSVKQVDPQVGQQLQELMDLANSMHEGETQEEKDLKKALASTGIPEVQQVLQERLESIRENRGVDLETAMEVIQSNGYTVAQVLETGIKKLIGSKSWSVMNRKENNEE